MDAALRQKVASLPAKPGIYFFKNARGEVVYIGKARLLGDRVRSYFQATDDPKVRNILSQTTDIDFIVTDSEREAAFLENNFIQQIQPKFNLRLKDDKSFPYLKVTVMERFPRIAFSRGVEPDGAKYFGPFSLAHEARKLIHLVGKNFGVRNCEEKIPGKRKRACLEYELKLCSGPCIGGVSEAEYKESVSSALLFLEGKTQLLSKILKEKMRRAAEREDYEEAARLRDFIRTLEDIKVKPRLISVRLENQDIFGYARERGERAAYVFLMRRGKVRESRDFVFEEDESRPAGAVLAEFVSAFYADREVPAKILLPFEPERKSELEGALTAKAGKKVELAVPTRGKNRDLVRLAAKNAEILLRKKAEKGTSLALVQKELGLETLPVRIEGFDVSNTGGTETVASLVTFENGRPDKDGYRKYRIRTVEGPNDVASLEEVIRRRYSRVLDEHRPLPDLILVDGGKPQLGAAQKTLAELGLERVPLAALAKKEEIVFTPGHRDGLRLDRTSAALKLFQHIRDEAHRFAVTFHRQRRAKRSFA